MATLTVCWWWWCWGVGGAQVDSCEVIFCIEGSVTCCCTEPYDIPDILSSLQVCLLSKWVPVKAGEYLNEEANQGPPQCILQPLALLLCCSFHFIELNSSRFVFVSFFSYFPLFFIVFPPPRVQHCTRLPHHSNNIQIATVLMGTWGTLTHAASSPQTNICVYFRFETPCPQCSSLPYFPYPLINVMCLHKL